MKLLIAHPSLGGKNYHSSKTIDHKKILNNFDKIIYFSMFIFNTIFCLFADTCNVMVWKYRKLGTYKNLNLYIYLAMYITYYVITMYNFYYYVINIRIYTSERLDGIELII